MLGLGLSIPRVAVRAGDALVREVLSILSKYGTDAHVYLPGIGVINGLTAGNYLDSAGTTAATVDNPVGLVLDANGQLGSELVTNGDFSNGITGWTAAGSATISVVGGKLRILETTAVGAWAYQVITCVVGKTYKVSFNFESVAGSLYAAFVGTTVSGTQTYLASNLSATSYQFVFTATATTQYINVQPWAVAINREALFDNISVKEVIGIHATQSTTANKPILRLLSGRYYFDFVDGTDVLNATYPAGWESVTTIDAAPTGQATLTAQNIVGTYAITTDTYGRFVFKTITASELAIVQSYCNRLAGV